MRVGLAVIVVSGQVILNIIKIMTLNEEIYKTFMKTMLSEVFQKDIKVRLRPGFFPFVEPLSLIHI